MIFEPELTEWRRRFDDTDQDDEPGGFRADTERNAVTGVGAP